MVSLLGRTGGRVGSGAVGCRRVGWGFDRFALERGRQQLAPPPHAIRVNDVIETVVGRVGQQQANDDAAQPQRDSNFHQSRPIEGDHLPPAIGRTPQFLPPPVGNRFPAQHEAAQDVARVVHGHDGGRVRDPDDWQPDRLVGSQQPGQRHVDHHLEAHGRGEGHEYANRRSQRQAMGRIIRMQKIVVDEMPPPAEDHAGSDADLTADHRATWPPSAFAVARPNLQPLAASDSARCITSSRGAVLSVSADPPAAPNRWSLFRDPPALAHATGPRRLIVACNRRVGEGRVPAGRVATCSASARTVAQWRFDHLVPGDGLSLGSAVRGLDE